MQYANIMLALGGDTGTTVPKTEVSASEIAVLQLIHGAGSVFDVEPVTVGDEKSRRTSREEIRRLTEIYGGARVQAEDGRDVSVIQMLFPGAGAQAIKNIEDLDLPEELFKASSRVAPVEAKADEPDADDLGKLTKAQLLEEAERRGVEIASTATKAEIAAAIRAGGNDGVGDADGTEEEVFG